MTHEPSPSTPRRSGGSRDHWQEDFFMSLLPGDKSRLPPLLRQSAPIHFNSSANRETPP
jgi:hypothetical protein